jgi:iron(III) transport system substrate-binding protein
MINNLLIAKMMILCSAAALADSPARSEITVYSGRTKDLVGPVIDRFSQETGIKVNVRYGGTTELATTILEEGPNSPADIYFAQDAGGLGALAAEGRFRKLPDEILHRVSPKFRSRDGDWVGTSGRVRVAVYNTNLLRAEDLPDSILDFTDPKWKGKIGWSPTNGSFQAFVTAMRIQLGEEPTEKWLRGISANKPRVYPNNSSAVAAVAAGEVAVAFVNHYYLLIFLREKGGSVPARNHFFRRGDIGSLVNVAGVGILKSSRNPVAAAQFVEYLLRPETQGHFANAGKDNEYPVVEGVPNDSTTKPLSEIETPDVDLSKLADLKGTLKLMRKAGVLE